MHLTLIIPKEMTPEELEYIKNLSEEDNNKLLNGYAKLGGLSQTFLTTYTYDDWVKACVRIRFDILNKKNEKEYKKAEKIGNKALKKLEKNKLE
jgi:hypothetical protein